jgi:DNA modification methylase
MKLVDDRTGLKKTERHEIPKMPEGYYSGDEFNPNIPNFIKKCSTKYDDKSDTYKVPHFSKVLHISNRRSPVNDLHIYWSKKPHAAIHEYIEHYTKPGFLVLDPFAGSGGTALCALFQGCNAIAIDLSPAATFITKYYCTPLKLDEFQLVFNEFNKKIEAEIKWLYEARTSDGKKAHVAYTIWAQVYRCSKCLSFIPLSSCVEVPAYNKDGTPRKTRTGEQATEFACPHCYEHDTIQIIDPGSKRYGRVPIKSNIIIDEKTSKKRQDVFFPFPEACRTKESAINLETILSSCDSSAASFLIRRLIDIEKTPIPYDYPITRMMNVADDCKKWGVLWRAGVADFETVNEVFEKRALWAMSAFFDAVKKIPCNEDFHDALRGILSSSLWNCTRMYREREKGGGPQEGVYYLPPLSREVNAHNVVSGKARTFFSANSEIGNSIKSSNLLISTQSATNLAEIPDNSIDYIFTDPPYSWKVPYGELNFLWESFLELNTKWHDNEITISYVRNIDETAWASKLKLAMQECFRVLKPGRFLTLCYHDSAEGTWELVQDILYESGFVAEITDSALSIDTGQKSLKQLTSSAIAKRDLIINFRKPRPGEVTGTLTINGDEDLTTFSQKVTAIISEYLSGHPGTSKDRIFDEVVSRMVRAGQMEAHNFEDLLNRVAEPIMPEGSAGAGIRWYLKETELNAVDVAETNKEDAASEKVGVFITDFLQKNPEHEGVHYSDIFENFIYSVKDKPRRPLAEWLLDYFYKTGEGTYRLPVTDAERQVKKEGRAKGIARKIKHYIVHLEQNIPLPTNIRPNDVTIAEWIHHCRRAGMYEQGKILYEKGGIRLDLLSEEQQNSVEEDYDVCARMVARGIEQPAVQPKKGRKKKDILTI